MSDITVIVDVPAPIEVVVEVPGPQGPAGQNQSGHGSPVGVIVPAYVGSVYGDRDTGNLWLATGLTNADWVEGAGGGSSGVTTFNTRTGAVTLSKADVTGTGLAAADIGADASGAAAAAQAASLQKASNLSDVASAPTSRTNLGLGTAAVANKVAAGGAGVLDATDPTTTNARTPTAHAASHAAAGTDPVTLTEAQVTGLTADLAATEKSANKGVANGYASLDSGGHVPVGQLPAITMNTVWPGIVSQAAMLALAAEPGDVAVRTDISANFMLAALPASTLANWAQLADVASPVTSVAGKTGAVSLVEGDVANLTTDLAAKLAAANNLSDLASAPIARTSLGLGSAATHAATDFDAAGAAGAEQTRALAAEALLAPLASPALTGTPTAPTKAPATNNTDIATTAYADAAVAVETSRATTAEAGLVPTSRQVIAGTGLSGGGTLAADRTVSMPNVGPGAVGPIGDATHVAAVSTDAQGRVTALTSVPIASSVPVTTVATAGASQAVPLDGGVHDLTASAASCTLTFTGGTAGTVASARIVLRQDGTGGRAWALPTSIRPANGQYPNFTTVASHFDIIDVATYDGGTTYVVTQVVTNAAAMVAPGAPELLATTSAATAITLSWAVRAPGGAPLTAMNVQRGTAPGGESLLSAQAGTVTSYADSGLTSGTEYYYKVQAVSAAGAAISAEVAMIPRASGVGTFTDSSSNSRTATAQGTTGLITAPWGGTAWHGDGATGYVETGHTGSVFGINGANAWCIECFFRADVVFNGGVNGVLIGAWDGTTAGPFILYVSNGTSPAVAAATLGATSGSSFFGTGALTDTTVVHHAALYSDGTTVRVALDGTIVGSAVPTGGLASSTRTVRVGADAAGASGAAKDWFNGLIGNVRFSTVARYGSSNFAAPAAGSLVSDVNTSLLLNFGALL